MLIIGDVHGKFGALKETLKRHKHEKFILQLGDCGIGFVHDYTYKNHKTGEYITHKGIPDPEDFGDNFHFLRGNHDSPVVCRNHKNYLGDYGIITKYVPNNQKLFYIGGAFSIDSDRRTEGIDWWADEELSYNELNSAMELYEKERPDIVISHDAPKFICEEMHRGQKMYRNRTSSALQYMYELWQPSLWIFGHHHMNWELQFKETKFICLNELAMYNL